MATVITKKPAKMTNFHEVFKLCPLKPFHLCPRIYSKEETSQRHKIQASFLNVVFVVVILQRVKG